jgi:hypothetical protein
MTSRARDIADGKFSGDLEADSPTFVVDAANNRVGVGTSSPDYKLQVNNSSASAAADGLVVQNNGVTTAGHSAGIRFKYVGAEPAAIRATLLDAATGAAALTFFTSPDGAGASLAERARIDASGKLQVNTTGRNGMISVANVVGTFPAIHTRTETTAGQGLIEFHNPNGVCGEIVTSGSSTSYNTSSDYRLKEDVQPMVGSVDRLMALKPVNFAWKVDGSRVDGFLAHEAQEVVPECVTGEKDAVDDEGNPQYQGIDQSKIVPLLVAALQEAMAEIAELKADVAALKGA